MMKIEKKPLLLTLLFACVISCTACEQQSVEDISGRLTEVEAEKEAKSENENSVSLGRMEGGIYTNEYAGFTCDLDSAWQFYTAEELQALPENMAEVLEGTAFGDSVSQYENIIDMKAENVEALTTINVVYQKMNMAERLQYASLEDGEVIDLLLSQKDELAATYAQAGMDVESITSKNVTFVGEERTGLYTVAKIDGINQYIFQLFHYDLGQYSVTLTVSSFVDDKTEEILELFYDI